MTQLCIAGLACVMAFVVSAVPVTAFAGDTGEQHRLLSQQLRQRLEVLKDKIKDQREQHHNNPTTDSLQAQVADLQNKLAALTAQDAGLVTQLAAAQTQIAALLTRVSALETAGSGGSGGTSSPALTEFVKHLTVDLNPINGVKGPHVILSGVNLHLRSGSGATADNGTPLGLGNLIIGYNEGPHPDPTSARTGSHNLVGGTLNAFTASGGIVFGSQNWTQGGFSSILGGTGNLAQGMNSTILGGRANFTGSSDQTAP